MELSGPVLKTMHVRKITPARNVAVNL